MENYYLRIKKYRIENNHTSEYIAIQMEMSLKKYESIEKGMVDLKLSKLDKLVKILGIKKSEIFKLDT
ncbi:helix-turn-helix transcriptional regulator [Flavobacterium sp. LC2016-12]|uniref:helix-turn-helix domain-containing protein n=1 Tax=unclassified Flavobacterium TaxID=196869 RepID=UPI00188A122E|nr:helix-turn-helix transcriptional regulator [Flavobacterium sp. LC2016-12]MBF4464324.1 helix-turn-helix transcriptional regulator [Flavobacterium sp. LC2016-12]